MSELGQNQHSDTPQYETPAPPAQAALVGHVPVPVASAQPRTGPIGKLRSTGLCILLAVVTFGIYPLVWFYMTHDEMKRHSNEGLGGGIALILTIFVGFVMPYITSSEVGKLYEARGQRRPVSGATGLWYFPGMFLLVGPLVWFVTTNSALNNYWRSLGAR